MFNSSCAAPIRSLPLFTKLKRSKKRPRLARQLRLLDRQRRRKQALRIGTDDHLRRQDRDHSHDKCRPTAIVAGDRPAPARVHWLARAVRRPGKFGWNELMCAARSMASSWRSRSTLHDLGKGPGRQNHASEAADFGGSRVLMAGYSRCR